MAPRLRCAIYTRKSTEEGLEQGFNSLHAQREACEAYVLSQAGEGWTALKTVYDDGGFSGGSMERPALRALLADIDRALVDVVVVYKVDRLTRSLADFAKIVERFDRHGVSFVSVTQAFNTTTSMGRLTLNVLLSFAQFEREVTGERIRDKIAASKAKGLWMGGRVPLGYDVVDHRLAINPAEADVVRGIFRRYLELGSVRLLHADLRRTGVRSKSWVDKQGRQTGGNDFSRGALFYLLSNPAYRGAIRHKKVVHENAHPPVVDEALWTAVQRQLESGGSVLPSTGRHAAAVLLKGLVFDDQGNPMIASSTNKGTSRYRYYVSAPLVDGRDARRGSLSRVAMGALDDVVVDALAAKLKTGLSPSSDTRERVRTALRRVVVGADRVEMEVDPNSLVQRAPGDRISIPIRMKRRQTAMVIEAEGATKPAGRVDRALIRGVVLARTWAKMLENDQVGSVKELARHNGLCEHYTAKLLPLAYLAPDLTVSILEGRQPAALSLKALTGTPLPLDWDSQRRLFNA